MSAPQNLLHSGQYIIEETNGENKMLSYVKSEPVDENIGSQLHLLIIYILYIVLLFPFIIAVRTDKYRTKNKLRSQKVVYNFLKYNSIIFVISLSIDILYHVLTMFAKTMMQNVPNIILQLGLLRKYVRYPLYVSTVLYIPVLLKVYTSYNTIIEINKTLPLFMTIHFFTQLSYIIGFYIEWLK
jgi:hypothetical protein